MNATGIALEGKHTVEASELYMAFELSEKNWKLSLGSVNLPSRFARTLVKAVEEPTIEWNG